jgi:glycerophosphoryl diester phosphodiesterase
MSAEVANMTSTELASVNVGSWFNRRHPPIAREEYEQQRVPALSDVFQFLRDKPGVIYVELKTDGASSSSDLVRAVSDAIVQLAFQIRVVVVSFELPALSAIKSLDSAIRTGALFAPQRRPNVSWRAESIVNAAVECGADELLPHRLLSRPKLIEKARDRQLPIAVWTVDEQAWIPRATNLGIQALITNNPARMLALESP